MLLMLVAKAPGTALNIGWHSRFDVGGESGILVLRAHAAWVRACAALASAMLVGAVLAVREHYSRH